MDENEAPLVQPLSQQATSISDAIMWMQGSLLASMKTCIHPSMPSAKFHNHNILIYLKTVHHVCNQLK